MIFSNSDVHVLKACGITCVILVILMTFASYHFDPRNEMTPAMNLAISLPMLIVVCLDYGVALTPPFLVFINILAFMPTLVLMISMHVRVVVCSHTNENSEVAKIVFANLLGYAFLNVLIGTKIDKIVLLDCLFVSANMLVVFYILYRYHRQGEYGMKYSVVYYVAFLVIGAFSNLVLSFSNASYAAYIAIYGFVIPTLMTGIDLELARRKVSMEYEMTAMFPVRTSNLLAEEVEVIDLQQFDITDKVDWTAIRNNKVKVADEIRRLSFGGDLKEFHRVMFLSLVDCDEREGVWMKLGDLRNIMEKYIVNTSLLDISESDRETCKARFTELNKTYAAMSNSDACLLIKSQSPFVDVVCSLI